MKIIVNGEQAFKASKNQFAVGPSSSGYQVAYSADNSVFTLDEQAIVHANENLVYLGSMQYAWYKLSGNTDTVTVLI